MSHKHLRTLLIALTCTCLALGPSASSLAADSTPATHCIQLSSAFARRDRVRTFSCFKKCYAVKNHNARFHA